MITMIISDNPKDRELIRAICTAYGITVEELEALNQLDGYALAHQEFNENMKRAKWRCEKEAAKVANTLTDSARNSGLISDDMRFEWIMADRGTWTHPSFDPATLQAIDEPPTTGTPFIPDGDG